MGPSTGPRTTQVCLWDCFQMNQGTLGQAAWVGLIQSVAGLPSTDKLIEGPPPASQLALRRQTQTDAPIALEP